MSRAAAPFRIHTIHFAYPGNPEAIPLRDDQTLRFLGTEPEWDANGRDDPSAFVRGRRATMRVVFACRPRGRRAASGAWRIGAAGTGGPGVAEHRITLSFDRKGLSAPHEFRLDSRLPDALGRVTPVWHWMARRGATARPFGTTSHQFYLAWRRPIAVRNWAARTEPRDGPPGDPGRAWTYRRLMQWTTVLAAGKDDPKSICDALLSQLPGLGLRYALPAYTVLGMLYAGGGYCAGWYRMFQAMAGAHGVRLERRTFAVEWRVGRRDESRWCAIVVEAPGLGRRIPEESPSRFHDVDARPIPAARVESRTVSRYRFWGCPGLMADGHCINLLRHRGTWYLYDACFRTTAVELSRFRLPRSDPRRPIPLERLGNFKEAYLAVNVPFMLGSLFHKGKFYDTRHPDPDDHRFPARETRNGLTVKTSLIPNRNAGITLYWTT
ncbi:MAG TPA: hypothetical protein VF187_01355 [Gemmatimonadales bacterium]